MKKYIYLSLLISLISISSSYAGGYKVKLKINGISDTIVYLGNYYAGKRYAMDTIKLDKNGVGVFKGDTALKPGIYMILFPSRGMNFFEFLLDKNQNFSLETDTADFMKYMKVKGSKQNTAFYEFHRYMSDRREETKPLQEEYKKYKDKPKKQEKIKEQLIKEEEDVKVYWEKLSKEWKGTLFGLIVKSMIEPEIPDFKAPKGVENKDSAVQMMKYIWHKDHYFDNIDLTDDRLMRTPFFASRVKNFITKIVVQHPDSIIKEGEKLIEASRGSEDNFGYLVRYMFGYKDRSKLMGMDKVFVEISEKYYLSGEATWVDSSFIEKVRDRVVKEKPNLIGNIAPPLDKLETYEKEFISLSDLKNDYIIIVFWEPHCGHCKKIVPRLYKSFLQMKKDGIDVQTLSIQTQIETKPWEKFIEYHHMTNWINAYDKYNFSDFRNTYDIYSTPTIYILDKDKRIIGKRLSTRQVEQIIYGMEGKEVPVHAQENKKH